MATSPPLSLNDLLTERRWLVSLSRHLVASPNDAEDVAQETLVRALEHGERIPPLGRRNWLAATARNIALSTKRATYRRISRERSMSRSETAEESDTAELVALAEFRAQAANAVVALPDADRTVIVLRFYEGLSTVEVAERLGVEPAAARQRISRAVRRLRSSLNEKDRERTWGTAALALARQGSRDAAMGSGTALAMLAALVLVALGALRYWNARSEGSSSGVTQTAGLSLPIAADTGLKGSVTLIDPVTKLPAKGVEWFVIRTGDQDDGLVEVMGVEIPNPVPIARGTTGEDGLVNFSPGNNELVHVGTLRNETYARSSWPVLNEDSLMGGVELELALGQRVIGRVVDGLGGPVPGAVIVGEDYYGHLVELAVCDETGMFLADRIAAFPRAFVRHADGQVLPRRTNGRMIWAVPERAWSETLQDPWVGQYSAIPASMTANTHTLQDIVLPAPIQVTGRVVNQHRQPMKGALVSTNREAVARAAGRGSSEFRPLPWSPGGMIGYGETLTRSDGTFELEAAGLSRVLAVFTRSGSSLQVPLSGVAAGASIQDLEVVVRENPGVQLVLRDPTQPGGALQEFGSPPRQARLVPDLASDGAELNPRSKFTVPTSGIATLPPALLSTLTPSATLLLDGYEPVAIDFGTAENESSIAVELVPRGRMQVTLMPRANGDATAATERYQVLATSIAWDKAGRTPNWSKAWYQDGGSPHLQIVGSIEPGRTVEATQVAGSKVWFHLLRDSDRWNDPERVHSFGPFDTSEAEFTLEAPAPGPQLSQSEIQTRKYVESLPASRRCTVRLSVFNARSGAPIEGAALKGGMLASSVYGRSGSDGSIVGGSTPEHLPIEVWAHGMKTYRQLSPDLKPGDDVDLGAVSLNPLDRVRVQLTRADGAQVRAPWVLSYNSPWTRELSGFDGALYLLLEGGAPKTVKLCPEYYPVKDAEEVALTLSADGTEATCVVPDWQLVEIEVTGLDFVWRLAPAYLNAKRHDGNTARIYRAGTVGAAAVFRSALPDGEWTVTSGPLVELSSAPLRFTAARGREPLRLQTQAGAIRTE